MKPFIITQACMLVSYGIFGAAFEHQKIQLTDDPTAEIVNMAISPNGAYAVYISRLQVPEKKARKIRKEQYLQREWTSGFRVRSYPPTLLSDEQFFEGPPVYTTAVMLIDIADGKHKNMKNAVKASCVPNTVAFSSNGDMLAVGCDPDTLSGALRRIHLYNISGQNISTIKAKVHTDISPLQLLKVVSSSAPISSDIFCRRRR